MKNHMADLTHSLARGDAQAAAEVCTEGSVLEDLTPHAEVVGLQPISCYLGHRTTRIRHMWR